MKKQYYKILAYSLILSLISGAAVYALATRANNRIAVVDAIQLFNKYNLKLELESREKIRLQTINAQVDSVGNKLHLVAAEQNEDEIKKLTEAYNYLKTRLQREYAQGNQNIDVQVWKRLNPILESYGKGHKFHLIIGANGMGTVLYNDDCYDITNDVIKYANKLYENGN